MGTAAVGVWKTFSADVAIHALTYFGVLLLALVLFAFYGLGFYGDMVRSEHWAPWRPIVALALPLTLFGVAWLLRAGTGIAFTANAVGFLGALTLPIMLSSLFQDGAPWGIPDIDGPGRWFAYAAVGLVCAAVYALATRRSSAYAYLVGPGLWTAVGALGLFLEDGIELIDQGGISSLDQFTSDGISWVQMTAVLAAIVATLGIVRIAHRRGVIARAVVRSSVLVLPVVAVLATAFALVEGISGVSGRSAATVIIGLTGAATGLSGTLPFAWSDLGPRLRNWLAVTFRAIAVLALGTAWVATGWIGIPYEWVGYGLAVYASMVLLMYPELTGSARVLGYLVRAAGVGGLVVALVEPASCIAVGASILAAFGPTERWATWRERVGRIAPLPRPVPGGSALMVASVAAITVGVARLVPPDGSAVAVLGFGVLVAATRFATVDQSALRGMSRATPLFAGAAVVVAIARTAVGGLTIAGLGWLLIGAAAVVAVCTIGWLWRLPMVVTLLVPGVALALRPTGVTPAILNACVATVAAAALLAFALSREGPIAAEASALGHLAAWAAPIAAVGNRHAVLIGIAAVAVSHLGLAIADDHGRARLPGVTARSSVFLHALTGSIALPFAAVMAARTIPWFTAERSRTGLALALAAWLLAAVAALLRTRRVRETTHALGAVLAVIAVLVAVPDTTPLLATTWSAAAVLGARAWTLGSPAQSVPAWGMVLIAAMVTGAAAGVGASDVHEPLMVGAIAVIGLGAAAHRLGEPVRSWGLPPLFLGLLVLPAVVSLSVADGDRVVLASLVAAAVYAALVWLLHSGAFTVLVAGMVAIAYADLVPGPIGPLDHPLMWIPLGAVYLGLAMALPDRAPGHWLRSVAPGFLAGAAGVMGLAASLAAGSTDFPLTLLAIAAMVDLAALRWRSWDTAYVALGFVVWSGISAGGWWPAAALWWDAAALGVEASWRDDARSRRVLAPLSVAVAGAGVAAFGWWQEWNETDVTLAWAMAAVIAGAVGWVIRVWARRPRVTLWTPPVVTVHWLAIAVFLGMSLVVGGFWPAAALWLAAVAFLLEVEWEPDRPAARVFAFLAVAGAVAGFGALGWWQDWTELTTTLAIATTVVVAGGLGWSIRLRARRLRLTIWTLPMVTLHWLAAAGFIGAGFLVGGLWPSTALWLASLAVILEVEYRPEHQAAPILALGAVALAGSGLVALGALHHWGYAGQLVALSAVALGAGAPALALSLVSAPPRVRVWATPLHLLAQSAIGLAVVIGMDRYEGLPAAYANVTGALALEATGVGIWATVRRSEGGVLLGGALAWGALLCGGAWQDLSADGVVVYAGLVAAAAAALTLALLPLLWRARPAMWWPIALALSQTAALTTLLAIASTQPEYRGLAQSAIVLGGEALFFGIIGLVRKEAAWHQGAAAAGALAVLCAVAALGDVPIAWVLVLAISVAAATLLVAAHQRAGRAWAGAAVVAGWVLTAGAPLLAARLTVRDPWVWGADEVRFVVVAGVGAVGILLAGIVGGRWRLAYLAAAESLAALAGWPWPGTGTHVDTDALVSVVAVLVLALLEMERGRARLLGVAFTEGALQGMAALEVVAMAVALGVVGFPAYGRPSVVHLVLLFVESLLIVLWAVMTRVRRRLAAGAVGGLAVAVFPIARVVADLSGNGITSGGWLAIGAVLAVLALTIAGVLDRYGARIGARIRSLFELLEDWS